MSDEEPHESDQEWELESEEGYELGGEEVKFPYENVTLSASSKRFKEVPFDRLSALPDSLLIHILSFLQTRKAASTCVLSKRWRFLWTELPSLEFINLGRYTGENLRMFYSIVQSALAIRSGNNLERLVVSSYYDKSLASDVNALVEFVVKKMVREVSMSLYNYTLPEILYSNSSLTRLTLKWCIFNSQKPIMWRSLTALTLENIEVHEHGIGQILSGCPALDSLCLRGCWGFNCLEIDSQSVHTLEVDVDDWNQENEPLLEISAPYIKYLYVVGRMLRLRNIRSVLTATLDLDRYCDESYELRDLLVDLQHVKTLDLGSQSILAMSDLAKAGWKFPQSSRESLTVEAERYEESIFSIVALLESSPSLETLVVDGIGNTSLDLEWDPPGSIDLSCDLLHLKTVHINNFAGEPMLTLAQILLKRATVLEKMVIKEGKFSSTQASSFLRISQTLLSLPRSSQKAVVLFG